MGRSVTVTAAQQPAPPIAFPAQSAPGIALAAQPVSRIAFLDQIRAVVTLLVVFHHTAITYGGQGSWYYIESTGRFGKDPTATLLTLMCAIDQSFFMGVFFLLAGYVTPPAYERKGAARYLRDRAIRLGIPLLLFAYVLDALTNSIAGLARGRDFVFGFVVRVASLHYAPGPMWFVQVLLVFSLAYVAVLAVRRRGPRGNTPGDGATTSGDAHDGPGGDAAPLPRHRTLLLAALATGVAAFALRLAMPTGTEFAHMQIGYFASYLLLFALGCAAWRHRWLERIDARYARRWWTVALAAIPLLPVAVFTWHALVPGPLGASGGWNFDAALYALWEPFVAWGIILALLAFVRTRVPADRLRRLSRRAYAIYCFHPPVVVGISVALRAWMAPPALKFLAVGSLSCGVLYVVTGLLLRIRPVARVF